MNVRTAIVLGFAGLFASAAPGGKTKPVLVEFRSKFDQAVKEASLRNIPILFVAGKDHWGGCEALESGTLANKKFVPFAADRFVPLTGHSGRDHGTTEIEDPKDKKSKITVCAKFPTMNCGDHEQMAGRMSAFTKLDYKGLPFTAIVDPVKKTVIDSWTGDWSMSQMEKKIALIDKAMPGERVSAAVFAEYQAAMALQSDGKIKEAKEAFQKLSKKKLSKSMAAEVEKGLQDLASQG